MRTLECSIEMLQLPPEESVRLFSQFHFYPLFLLSHYSLQRGTKRYEVIYTSTYNKAQQYHQLVGYLLVSEGRGTETVHKFTIADWRHFSLEILERIALANLRTSTINLHQHEANKVLDILLEGCNV
jgi:hypothetical protein